jgi:hypothetical protein
MPHFAEVLTASIGHRLGEQVKQYKLEHGETPHPADLWEILHSKPIHNPLNGSAEVVKLGEEFDERSVGWILDGRSGDVYPGYLFPRHSATPESQTGRDEGAGH